MDYIAYISGRSGGTLEGVALAIVSLATAQRDEAAAAWVAHRGYDAAKAARLRTAIFRARCDAGELAGRAPVGRAAPVVAAPVVRRARKARKSCVTGGNCSSFGSGRSCGGHDCDGH